jgi:hypothetical protein
VGGQRGELLVGPLPAVEQRVLGFPGLLVDQAAQQVGRDGRVAGQAAQSGPGGPIVVVEDRIVDVQRNLPWSTSKVSP